MKNKTISKVFVLIIIFSLTLMSCKENTAYKEQLEDPELFQSAMKKLTDVIVYDIFSPPVASRVYMYPSVASYAVMQKAYPDKYNALEGQLKDLSTIPEPTDENIDFHLASFHAFTVVGKQLIFSEQKITDFQIETYKELQNAGLPDNMLKVSKEYGNKVADHILKWAKGDLYDQTRTYSKYTILDEDKFWKPTPPDYMDGIEPHWNKIRTLVLKSADQFPPIPPLEFDLTKGSEFQKQLMEVYEKGQGTDADSKEIASFWDCKSLCITSSRSCYVCY